MQTSQFSFRKSMWLLLPFTIALIFLLGISGCKEDTRNFKESKLDASEASCMTLTKAQIESNWVTQYTNPNNPPETKMTVLRFYAVHNPTTKGFNISVQAFNGAQKPLGDIIDLNRGKGCDVAMPSVVTSKVYDVTLSSLQMLKADGSLIDFFTKLIVTPGYFEMGGVYFLQLNMAVATDDGVTQRGSGLPCPPCPNCNPPCPDWCVPVCPPKDPTDSLTGSGDTPLEKVNDTTKIQ